jgi:sulfatase modifying factor 1
MERSTFLAVLVSGALGCSSTVSDVPPPPKPSPYENTCPKKGGQMVEVPDNHGSSYCIDATEVTNAAYGAWLDTKPSLDLMPAHCHEQVLSFSLLDYRPQDITAGIGKALKWPVDPRFDSYPVVWVTWCDAAAFCTGQGKRLCGAIGGGPLQPLDTDPGFIDPADPRRSEFMNALTRGDSRKHVYGNVKEPDACWPEAGTEMGGEPVAKVHAVATKPDCEGGYDGVFDLEGNALELVDACVLHAVGEDSDLGPAACVTIADPIEGDHWVSYYRSEDFVGFRCCADVPDAK